MKKQQIRIGGIYMAKVSDKVVPVRIVAESRYGGWDAVNTRTNRKVRIKSARRLRCEAEPATRKAATAAAATRQVVIGHVYAVMIDGQCHDVRADKALDDGRYRGTIMNGGRKAKPITFAVDAIQNGNNGLPEYRWREQQAEAAGPHAAPVATSEAKPTPGTPASKERGTGQRGDDSAKGQAAPGRKRAGGAAGGDRRPSGLDAAAKVLADATEPLSAGEMVERMLTRGLWRTNGKTPANTLYAAILREINAKGDAARFRKAGCGKFELARA